MDNQKSPEVSKRQIVTVWTFRKRTLAADHTQEVVATQIERPADQFNVRGYLFYAVENPLTGFWHVFESSTGVAVGYDIDKTQAMTDVRKDVTQSSGTTIVRQLSEARVAAKTAKYITNEAFFRGFEGHLIQ